MSAFEDIVMKGNRAPYIENDDKKEPGFINAAAHNFLGGLEGMGGDLLKGIGAQLNALDEAGRESSYVESIRDSDHGTLGLLGDGFVNNGAYLSNQAEDIAKQYGTRAEYANLGFMDRLMNADYLTDTRGLASDVFTGFGSSVPFVAGSLVAPEITLPGRALQAMRAIPYAGRLSTALLDRGAGSALNQMAGSAALTTPLDAFTNAAGIYDELKKQGLSDTEIAAKIREAAVEEAPYDFLSSAILGGTVSGKLGKAIAGKNGGLSRNLLGGASTIPIEMASEYLQESMQQRMNNKYTGKPYGDLLHPTEDESAAGATAAFGALIPAAGGAAHTAYRGYREGMPSGEISTDENNINGFDGNLIEKWESKPGATDLQNVQPSVKAAFNGLAEEYGGGITITGGAEKGYHEEGEFGHEGGWKLDVDKNSIRDPEKFFQLCSKYGFAVGDEGDHYDLSAHSEGGTGGRLMARPEKYVNQGGSEASPAGQREGHENAWAIYDVFHNAGYSDNAIAGILGRVQQEHNFETSNVEEYDDENGRHLGGYGMFQWNGGRTQAFLNWAQQNNLDPQSATVQAQYALLEAEQRGLTPEKMNGLSHEDAATLWTDKWEVGDPGEERKYAGEWLERIGKGGKAGGAAMESSSARQTQDVPALEDDTSLYEGFAREQLEASRNAEDVDFFHAFFKDNGNFKNTEENLAKIRERVQGDLAEEYEDYVSRQRAKQETGGQQRQGKSAPEAPRIETKANSLEAIRQKLTDHQEAAIAQGDLNAYNAIASTLRSGDTARMKQLANSLPDVQTGQQESAQNSSSPTQTPDVASQSTQQGAPSKNAPKISSKVDGFLSRLGIDPARIQEERQNIREAHFSQLATDEASTGRIPHLDRAINKSGEKAANNMAMAGFFGSGRWERGIIGAKLEEALKNPSTAQEAMDVIRQMQQEDEAAYFSQDGYVHQGVGANRKPMLIRRKDSGLTQEAIQKYARQDWHNFAQREGYSPSNEAAPHTLSQSGQKSQPTQGQAKSAQNQGVNMRDAYETGMGPMAETVEGRQRQGKGLLLVARTAGIQLPSGLPGELRNGSRNAIPKAQQILRDAGVSLALDDFIHLSRDALNRAIGGMTNESTKTAESTETKAEERAVGTEHQGEHAESEQAEEQSEVKQGEAPQNRAGEANGEGRKETPARKEKTSQNEGQEESAQAKGAATPQMEATGRNEFVDIFRAKYKNGEVTIRLSRNADGQQRTAKISWNEMLEILESDNPYAKLAPIVDKLTGDLKDRKAVGYNSAERLQSYLYDTLRNLKGKLDSATRLREREPEIRARMKKLIEEENIGEIVAYLSNNANKVSIKAFSDETGVNLSPVMKTRMQQVREYFGEKYDQWQKSKDAEKQEKERQEAEKKEQKRQERIQNAEKDWRDGKEISGEDFLLLCDKYDVDVPISTKGTLRNKINSIKNDGTIYSAKMKKYPQGVATVFRRLNEAMEESAQNKKAANEGGQENDIATANNGNIDSIVEDVEAVKKSLVDLARNSWADKSVQGKVSFKPSRKLRDKVQELFGHDISEVFVTADDMRHIRNHHSENEEKRGQQSLTPEDVADIYDVVNDFATATKEESDPKGNQKMMVVKDKNGKMYALLIERGKRKVEVKTAFKKQTGMSDVTSPEPNVRNDSQSASSASSVTQEQEKSKQESASQTAKDTTGGVGDGKERRQGEGASEGREGVQSGIVEGTEGRGNEPSGVSGGLSGRSRQEGTGDAGNAEREDSAGSGTGGVREGAELEAANGEGTGERGSDESFAELTEAQAHPSPEEIPGHDYEIKESAAGKTGEKVRFRQNIDAIKMLKRLEEEDRMPTPKEQEVLGAYNGWGGLKKAFLDNTQENRELRELLTDEEYKAAKATMNDAFYTSPGIVRAIWEGISRLGFKGGRILDPSMGIGNFFGCMPRGMMKKSGLWGVEIDGLTSRFARMLYPSAQVEHKPFQKSSMPDNYFDLVVSNIPFGQLKIDGYQIHNYFFAAGMDKVRPGGLMVFITSQGSLAGGQDAAKMRSYLAGKADMIAAYKLPSGAFSEAGTSVGTDVVIFRKRGEDGKKSPYAQDFLKVDEKKSNSGYYSTKLYDVNEYFEKHPENIIGEAKAGKDQFGNPALEVKARKDESIEDALSKAMKSLPEGAYQAQTREKKKQFDTTEANKRARADEKSRDLEYYEKGGKIFQNQNGEAVAVTGKKAAVLKDYLAVKRALGSLLIAERDPKATDKQLDSMRKALNKAYNAFTGTHGYLHHPAAMRNYQDDPSAGMVLALEKVDYEGAGKNRKISKVKKSDIFTQRTVQAIQEVKSAENPSDALLASLSNHGYVDMDYMAGLLKSTPEKIAKVLSGKIFKDPATEDYVTREEYLSGNVREKLAQAETAARKDKSYQKNVEELKKVIPEDLVSDEILVNMGAPWIPAEDVQAFAESVQGYGKLTVSFSPGAAKWTVSGYGGNQKYSIQGMSLADMMDHILNNRAIEIYDGSGKERIFNQEKTDAANVTADEIRRDFREWLWSDKERERRLVRYYNDNYNNTVVREYDGSHLTFPGMNSKINLKPHQKNVVWRMLQKGNTLIAHGVGLGKTFEMQAAGMEMRRLGIANKPLYCLPNNVVEQFAREFRQLYPNAKLLVLQSDSLPAVPKMTRTVKTEDGRKKTERVDMASLPAGEQEKIFRARAERNRTLARIRTEDWDGIILSHDMFQRLPLHPETVASYVQEEMDSLKRTIQAAKGTEKLDTRTLSNLEQRQIALQNRMEDILATDLSDIGIPFEELGIDQIFVDEADLFKNLHYNTRMDRVSGLSNSDANRSNDMFVKTQWLTQAMGGRGVVFATGTPISNTMAEMYTMMRYLDMRSLKEKGLDLFDNWMRTFAEIGSGIERKPSGDGFRKVNKVLRFINMAELTKMFRKFTDVKTADDVDIERPALKNGKPTVVKIESDPSIVRYIKEEVPKRIAAMKRNKKGEKGADNMLALTGDLRKMALNDAKIEACADQIVKKFHETTEVSGAQLVFCDMGIPKAQKDNAESADLDAADTETENDSIYGKLMAALRRKGIPANQIAFVQSAKNKQQQDELFQKVNEGKVRILIGSTQKMGAGTNCQKHLVALHDLDAPWRPRDLEQRHGRILRQGNENKEVEIFNYVVQDSFDANMWEKLKNKAAIIAQAMSGDTTIRAVEDADLVTLSYAEVEGAATGNPLIKERLSLNNEVTKYQHAQTAFKRRQRDAETVLSTYPEQIAMDWEIAGRIEDDRKARQDTSGQNFRMVLNGKTYTERAKAQKALEAILPRVTKTSSVKIGEIGGFDLKAIYTKAGYTVDGASDGKVVLSLVRKRSYPVQTDSVIGIENALRKNPDASLERLQKEIERMEHELSDAEKTVQQRNPYEEKLREMTSRLAEIDREIESSMMEGGRKQEQAEESLEENSMEKSEPAQGERETDETSPEAAAVDSRKAQDKAATEKEKPLEESSMNFEVGEFTHTKTGEQMYQAKLRDKVERDTYMKLNSLAKRHGGGYSRFAKTFLFRDEAKRDAFLKEADEILSGEKPSSNRKYSLDNSDKIRDNKLNEVDVERRNRAIFDDVKKHFLAKMEELRGRGLSEAKIKEILTSKSTRLQEEVIQPWIVAYNRYVGRVANKRDLMKDIINDEAFVKSMTPQEVDFYFEAFKGRLKGMMDDAGVVYKECAFRWANGRDVAELGSWRELEQSIASHKGTARFKERPAARQNSIRPESRSEEDGFSNARSIDVLKAEAKEAFPNAKVQEQGNTLVMTMPNGQRVTVTLHESITASDAELGRAKAEHGIPNHATVTIEGYAETVGEEGFVALSQGSREGTGFHEAYHIAEAMAFTEKELRDAKRLISGNEEERADAYARWRKSRKRFGNFAKLWQKISDFAAKMAGILGFETKHNLFRKISSGEIYERKNKGSDVERKYSVNPSDNSNPSLFQKIKNILSGTKPTEYRHRKMMADLLGKALNLTIRGGKISDSKGNVIYKESDRVIRSRHMYDWENILPVAGSVIAERLGIVKKASQTPEEMRNYIASWILTGNPNNTSSEAKEFQEAMQRNPFLADSLMKVREAFEEWNSMDAKEQMRETIQMTKAQKTNWKEVMEHTYDQLVEELGPVERLVQEIQGEMKKAGHTLSHAVNPMVAFRLARGSHGRAITMIEGRGEAAVNALKKNFPNVDFTGFKTLHDILKDIKAFQNIEKQRDFITYCTACHVMDMHRKNTDIRLEQQHLRNKAAKAQDKKERKDLEKQAEALEKEIMPIPDAFTEENCEKYIREGEEEYAQAQKDLVQFSNTSAAILADSGVISQKRYRELLSSWPNYVPMFRVFEDNEDIDFGDSLRHIKGSLRDIVNPLESIIRNTTEFVRKAEYNKARCLLANLARCDGSGMLLEEVDNSKPNDKTTITFYEDGVRKYLQTDPSVVQAVNNMNRGNSNAVLHVLHAITSVARACFTIASPEFATRNIFRDYADMAVYNKNGFVSPADMIRAFLHAVRRDETYYEWLSSGAAIASAVSLDRNYTQETIDKLGRSWRKRLASKQFLPALLEGLQKASEYSEYATRIAMYEKTKQHLTKGETKAAAYEAMVGAAFESRDLMDFARHGKAGEFWNKLVPFANASLQGMNKFYRTCLDPKGWRERPKEMAWALARLMLSSAIPAMLLCLLHRDEDWYKEAPDWLKETHWLIPVGDTILRIPKGSDVGIRYISNLVEKGMSGKSYSMKEYNMPLWDALPDLLPIATKPIIEAYLNKSFFTGRNIVPQWQEKLPEKLQYGPYTTGMAKVVGELLGIAPSKIDHVLSGYVGSVGMALWKGLDILAGDRQLDTALEEMPLTRALTYMPYKNPQSVQDFYKKLDEQTKLENEFKLTGKRPDGLDPALLNRLKVVKKQLAPLSKREREIVDNKGYSLEQRKRMQMEIQQRRIRIVEGALGK